MDSQAAADLEAINAVLGTEPKPTPKPKIVKPVDGAGDVGELVVAPKKAAPVPVPEPVRAEVPEGWPDIEADAGVKTAREALQRIEDKRAANAAEQREVESALGLRANPTDEEINALAVMLIVADGDESEVEKLRRLRHRAALLAAAADEGRAAVKKAIEAATRALTEQAWTVGFKPKARATALALLHLIKCFAAEQEERARLRAGGYMQPNGTLSPIGLLDPLRNPEVLHLIREGYLDRSEVREVLPHLGL